MSVAEETAAVVEQLAPEQARSVLEFARFLAERQADNQWEQRLSTAHELPKFRNFIAEAERELAAGRSEPMDLDKL
jgi:hypothetical protein